ncbi:hypothetical protein [Caproiciproducens sp. MSJ-32]|uniref:hypothetical protein n=1 Tax=Caproiciproducens sp. MSJ-32 TaxID=2841527 RepID=UPI0025704A80|nr:hypothetical protein [Caproiciproducens sp. MSJ-32]
MFCSVKSDKKNNKYRFYISDRYRDKKTGKVKSSDKYIMTLQEKDILNLSYEEIKKQIETKFIYKGLNLENVSLVLNKIMNLKNVVIKNYDTTEKIKTGECKPPVEIVKAEIVEEKDIDYKRLIMFDVMQDYQRNIREQLNFEGLTGALGKAPKDRFEIEEDELKKIRDKAYTIEDRIISILLEYEEVKELNEKFKALGSDISVVQDIYISCYDKSVKSELWLVGNGYIENISELSKIIFPHEGKCFKWWRDAKRINELDDNKMYIDYDDYFKEIDLYRFSNIEVDKKDITGSLIKIMLSGNCEVEYSMSDWIDIKSVDIDTSLNIEHLVDWINNKPTRYYKVDIEALLQYKEQLYKYMNVKI